MYRGHIGSLQPDHYLCPAGIEDKDNWHGKPLGDKCAEAVETLKASLANQGPHGLTPAPPEVKAPAVSVANIKLSEAPKYDMGQQVRRMDLPLSHSRGSQVKPLLL